MNWKKILNPISFYIYLTSLLGITGLKCFIINHVTYESDVDWTDHYTLLYETISFCFGPQEKQLHPITDLGHHYNQTQYSFTCLYSCTVRSVKYELKLYFRVKMSWEWLEKAGVCVAVAAVRRTWVMITVTNPETYSTTHPVH